LNAALPDAVRRGVEASLEKIDRRAVAVRSASPVSGGSISAAVRLNTQGGDTYFLKWRTATPEGMFAAEAAGLAALRSAAAGAGFRVPEVFAHASGAGASPGWILMEWVPRGTGSAGWGAALGRAVAGLHGAGAPGPGGYGWEQDNFIGPLPQDNTPSGHWATFWRERRLVPQLDLATQRGHFQGHGRTMDLVLDRLDEALSGVPAEGPSLLHGDLWSGNVYPGPAGEPVLVDPAVYRGHGEVDLAMSELFGGFPEGFLDAYGEVRPLGSNYRRVRRPLYQLYYLLVHVNLFGAAYLGESIRAAESALAGL